MKVTLKIENNSFFLLFVCQKLAERWPPLHSLYIVQTTYSRRGRGCKYTLEQIYQTLQKLNSTMFAISTNLPALKSDNCENPELNESICNIVNHNGGVRDCQLHHRQ